MGHSLGLGPSSHGLFAFLGLLVVGVVLAVRAVPERPGLTVGLDSLLGL